MSGKHYRRGYHPNSRKALARFRPCFNAESAVEAGKRSANRRRYLATLKSYKALVKAVDNATTTEDIEKVAQTIIDLAIAGNIPAFKYLVWITDGIKL